MLRRLSCLLLSALTLFSLSACSSGKKGTEEPVTAGFECDMDVQYRDMDVKGHLTRQTAGTLRMEVTEPASLNGLSMEWNGENSCGFTGFPLTLTPPPSRRARWEKESSARWIRRSVCTRTGR